MLGTHKRKLTDTPPPRSWFLRFEIRWDKFSHSELIRCPRWGAAVPKRSPENEVITDYGNVTCDRNPDDRLLGIVEPNRYVRSVI